MNRLIYLAIFVLVLWRPPQAAAFNGTGHTIIAAFAYRQLTTDQKEAFTVLLKHHPAYPRWRDAFEGTEGELDFGMFLFMRASKWPDEIRRTGNPFDHPNWHFVDYPIRPPDFPNEGSPAPEDDILFGISQSSEAIENPDLPDEARAAHLSWLIHLIGDLHQPLHCATLINETYPAPDGDRGGNSFYIRPGNRAVKLHSFWDGLLGKSSNLRSAVNVAIALQNRFPAADLNELRNARNPLAWSLASRKLAKEVAYRNAELPGSADTEDVPALPDGYAATAKNTAEKQGALAGYRLGKVLSALNLQ
jgi:S1/P1 Nuclease